MNTDWKNLKLSSSGLPTWDSFIPYILEVLKNGEETTRGVIVKRVLEFLDVPQKLRSQEYSNNESSQSVLYNRIGFALADLYKANAITRPKRAVYQITEKGNRLLKSYGDKLTADVLQEQPEYIAYMEELKLRSKRSEDKSEDSMEDNISITSLDNEENHQEVVEKLINKRNNEIEIELLNKLRETDPIFFEKLVVKLLDMMGYSGKNGNVQVTTQSNDGGIDGIINQDPLGTSTVYLQVKRYTEKNVIGRPAIQAFYGALASVNADRGVFITTSSFSKGALEFAKNQGIVLIDGIQLTELMIEYKVGVEPAQEYVVYQINYDDFESEE
ncbi:restriction endonuclease [Aerococcus urinaeequi]|uniref:Restriction endonuclease n=1 Tax=Aerococcus urinaeequi TaxID=51665 RepID=A0A7M1KY51_9LACT|nr:restriction endonuclease [Aerococcus urinaeequi]QOQ79909.1 restriction endonuclease [Aerococcus urinaeequi]